MCGKASIDTRHSRVGRAMTNHGVGWPWGLRKYIFPACLVFSYVLTVSVFHMFVGNASPVVSNREQRVPTTICGCIVRSLKDSRDVSKRNALLALQISILPLTRRIDTGNDASDVSVPNKVAVWTTSLFQEVEDTYIKLYIVM